MKSFFSTDTSDYGILFLRIFGALAMLPFGLQKLGILAIPNVPGGIDQTIQMMTTMGVPPVITILVIIAETVGTFALFFGLFTRFCAGALAVIMIGAIWFTYGMGYFMGYATPLLFLIIFIPLLINGAGAFSLDGLIAKKMK